MKTTHRLLALVALLSALPAFSAVLLNDNFGNPAASALNTTPPGWTVSNGTVDYIRNTDFGITCRGNAGGCVDLDGSTNDAGVFTYGSTFNLTGLTTYTLTYWLSGNQRNGANDTVTVNFGGVTNTHILAANAAFQQFSIVLTPLGNTTVSLSFSNAGGDNLGAILDDVFITDQAVPEPSTYFTFAAGLLAFAAARRRR